MRTGAERGTDKWSLGRLQGHISNAVGGLHLLWCTATASFVGVRYLACVVVG